MRSSAPMRAVKRVVPMSARFSLFDSRCGVLARSGAGAERRRVRASAVARWGLRGPGSVTRLAGVVLDWMI